MVTRVGEGLSSDSIRPSGEVANYGEFGWQPGSGTNGNHINQVNRERSYSQLT
jgi:hypothetical protein